MWYSKCQLSESRVPAAPLIVMQPQTQNVRALMYSEIPPLRPPFSPSKLSLYVLYGLTSETVPTSYWICLYSYITKGFAGTDKARFDSFLQFKHTHTHTHMLPLTLELHYSDIFLNCTKNITRL